MTENKEKELELYIHIPFCVRKCNYCDFLSAPAAPKRQEEYMTALFKEIRGRAEEYKGYVVTSVFVGGGTPSVICGSRMEELFVLIGSCYHLSEEAEITIEMNPGTADREKLRAYKRAGVNRLSIGLQTMKEEELKRLGRIHTREEFLDCYRLAVEEGFRNINVDVMSALPGQSLNDYRETLKQVVSLSPPPVHISAYSLIVEDGTPFAEWEATGELELPDEECERLMYEETEHILKKNGYERYEISNYAKKGFECRHNCGYWQRKNYAGFGIGAASLIENVRFGNGEDLAAYIESPLDSRKTEQHLDIRQQMEEFMFLGLRMCEGISEKEFEQSFGSTLSEIYGSVIDKNLSDGLLSVYDREGERRLALTHRGLDLSNYVMAQFLLS